MVRVFFQCSRGPTPANARSGARRLAVLARAAGARSLLVCSVVALLSGSAIAQVTNGEIIGKVTDQTNAGVPGVTVTLESPAIQQPMTTVTQVSGGYQFVQVPIGTYTITFQLSGFKTVKRAGVVIETGFTAEVNTKLEVSTREEVINVTAASPVVDTKNTTTGAVINRETLDVIPTARDPWVALNMVPGVMLSGVNVGGSASGQQLTVTTRGVGDNQNMWNIEGASITDMSALGASTVYYDFDSFQEIQVTTGGSDASVQSGGLNINLISKSGSNVFKGTASGAYQDDNMQWTNITRDLFYGGGNAASPLTGTPMLKNYEYGADAGGPITRNRLWYYARRAPPAHQQPRRRLLPVDPRVHARPEYVRANQGDAALHAPGLDRAQQPEREVQLSAELGEPVPVPGQLRRQGAERARRQRDAAARDGVRADVR